MEPDQHNNVKPGDRVRYKAKGQPDAHTGTVQSAVRGWDRSIGGYDMGYQIREDHPEDPTLNHEVAWHAVSLEFIERIDAD
jgi:hypothetical protein